MLRNPVDSRAGGRPGRRPPACERSRSRTADEFLLEYIELLLHEGQNEAEGFRHKAGETQTRHQRWAINKVRALMSWYSKGTHNGAHLRTTVNTLQTIPELRDFLRDFFKLPVAILD